MRKIKFDFDTETVEIKSKFNPNVNIGCPVDNTGKLANNSNAYGIVVDVIGTGNSRRLVVAVSGYIDTIDAMYVWGGEYDSDAISAMSNLVFCDNHKIPSGADPALDNAKATGGIGWTEQGEQTTIEWDGNTTGKVVVDGGGSGAWCLVSNKTPSVQDVIGGKFYISGFGDIEITAESIMELDNIYSFESGAFMVAFEPTTVGGINFPYTGVYFSTEVANKTSSLTYGTPDTVHKIDEKYINGGGGGGAMLVNATYDEQTDTTTFDKTFDEIFASAPNVVVKYVNDSLVFKLEEYGENIINFGYTNIGVVDDTITVIMHYRLQLDTDNVIVSTYGKKSF